MIFFSNFLIAAAVVINWVLKVYMWIIIARAILSWVSPDPYNPIVRFIHNVTEPILYQVRKRMPIKLGGIDFSPIIVILAIVFLQVFVVQSLIDWADTLVK
jgi:YggT family protein